MATTKKRINITLSPELERTVKVLARREKVPQATKIAELLHRAIEMEEDEVLERIVTDREKDTSGFVTHKDAWS